QERANARKRRRPCCLSPKRGAESSPDGRPSAGTEGFYLVRKRAKRTEHRARLACAEPPRLGMSGQEPRSQNGIRSRALLDHGKVQKTFSLGISGMMNFVFSIDLAARAF